MLMLPENLDLVAAVHPADWVNPDPQGVYNLVIVGAGPAGLICAAGAAGLGARVALIESALMGGDCLNTGCVPSKSLIRAARALYDARIGKQFGLTGTDKIGFDFSAAMERMRRLRATISLHDSARRFRDELGVDVYFGNGRFTGQNSFEVGDKKLCFKKAAVCTGARASVPSIPGLEETGYLTNETVFSLTELPPRMVVIGAGAIGCELAQSFARFGCRVTLLEHGEHILIHEDTDASRILHEKLIREGLDIRFKTKILSAGKRGAEKLLKIDQQGQTVDILTDAILVAVGRTPNLEGIGLEAAGIDYHPNGIKVNDTLQTSNPDIYAAGDICTACKFTNTADAMARIVITNALFMGRQKSSALTIPRCIYTDPEIAQVGLTAREAERKGIQTTTITVPLSEVDRAMIEAEEDGFARVHLKKGTDKIVGATIVARHAGEMINELSLAMVNRLGMGAIARTIHPYPTQAEVIKKLADSYNRTRLTPLAKRIISSWLEFRRG